MRPITADEAFAICEQNGWMDQIRADVEAAPPVSDELADRLRDLLNHLPTVEELREQVAEALPVTVNRDGLQVSCEACGTVLVISESRHGEEAARELALRNVAGNPCCDRWRNVDDDNDDG